MSGRDDWVAIAAIYKGYAKGDAWCFSDDGFTEDVATNRAFTSLTWAKRYAKGVADDRVRFIRPNPDTNPNYFEVLERRPR